MDESPSGRGPLLVGLAVLLLAIIGAAVGLILGHNTVDTSVVGVGDSSGTGPGPAKTSSGGTPTTTQPPIACPDRMQDLAKFPLVLVLYVRTEVSGDAKPSEVWICKNSEARLFYQGHRGPKGEDLTRDNSLFLTDVSYVEATGFRATNHAARGDTTYLIANGTLTITYPDGSTEKEPVVESHDGPA